MNWILMYLVGILLLYAVARLLLGPLRLVGKLIWNALLGGALLYVLNLLGDKIGITLPLNPISALVVGFLGIPGVILLLALQYLIP